MSFKEFKKRDKIKTWENKLRRLYACETITDEDLKYVNIQYDIYKLRKNNSNKNKMNLLSLFYIILFYLFNNKIKLMFGDSLVVE